MEKLKVCFVGVGSIAKRHIRNLRIVCRERGIEVKIDAYRSSKTGDKPDGIDELYFDINQVPDNYDAIFITNPTRMHLESLHRFHDKAANFFIEKPVVSETQISEAEGLKLKEGSVYYVAAPLRYCSVIRYVKENVDPSDVVGIRCISSSYLPDWRPGQDYRDTYSAHRALGGGVSIDLIHEWDYLVHIFGMPERVLSMMGKKSELELDSDDYAIYIAEYENHIAELHLDYFGRKTIREIQLFTKKETIVGDLVNNRVNFLLEGKTIDFDEDRDAYQQKELEYFLDMISGEIEAEDGFRGGLRVLKLTQGQIMP